MAPMLTVLDALLGQPILLLLVLGAGAAIGVGVEKLFARIERDKRRAYWAGRNGKRGKSNGAGPRLIPPGGSAKDSRAVDQLETVMNADFRPRALLNRPEAQVFAALDAIVIARNPHWQVMAQVSLGEFLASGDKDAYACINSKRVDFALMDGDAQVRHALEYQGNGHHLAGNGAAARDAVKKEALRKAGIGYHEIVAGHTTPAELRRLIDRLVPEGPPPPQARFGERGGATPDQSGTAQPRRRSPPTRRSTAIG